MFRESVIESLATCIGDPIMIDGNTFTAKRGRFARFCVQVKTNQPLEIGIYICGKVYQVVYENLPSLCHSCGRVGHTIGECSGKKSKDVRPNVTEQVPSAQQDETVTMKSSEEGDSSWLTEKAKNKEFGDWMVVERRKKKTPSGGRNAVKNLEHQERNSGAGNPPCRPETGQFRTWTRPEYLWTER